MECPARSKLSNPGGVRNDLSGRRRRLGRRDLGGRDGWRGRGEGGSGRVSGERRRRKWSGRDRRRRSLSERGRDELRIGERGRLDRREGGGCDGRRRTAGGGNVRCGA